MRSGVSGTGRRTAQAVPAAAGPSCHTRIATFRSVNGKEYPGPGGAVTGARGSTAPAVSRAAVGAVDGLELLQRASRADRHAGQRRLGQVRRHLRLLAQPLVEAVQ